MYLRARKFHIVLAWVFRKQSLRKGFCGIILRRGCNSREPDWRRRGVRQGRCGNQWANISHVTKLATTWFEVGLSSILEGCLQRSSQIASQDSSCKARRKTLMCSPQAPIGPWFSPSGIKSLMIPSSIHHPSIQGTHLRKEVSSAQSTPEVWRGGLCVQGVLGLYKDT